MLARTSTRAAGSLLAASFAFLALPAALAQPAPPLEVRLVTDEADAVVAVLAKKMRGETVTTEDWDRLFSSEGYLRLKKREAELKRAFEDSEFQAFVLSEDLFSRASALRDTLEHWKQADLTGAAQRALAYLPAGTRLRASVYPVIKPQTNSFVFEVTTDPAIFLYLDPRQTEAQFENTVAHELHHIGYASACASKLESGVLAEASPNVRAVLEWIGAFGEGVAMLAAAGGPEAHPHAASPPEDQARWEQDVANFDADLRRVESFFFDLLDARLADPEKIREAGFSFFGVQGPWYTVGWRMAVTVEQVYGRAELIGCLCDPAKFLLSYNRAAEAQHPAGPGRPALWSPRLLEAIAPEARAGRRGKD